MAYALPAQAKRARVRGQSKHDHHEDELLGTLRQHHTADRSRSREGIEHQRQPQ
jgi:hypothetical protein